MRWVIGDVHGMRLALESLLARVQSRDASPRLLFTGDYVNRGPDSRAVIDLLISLKDVARFVRGNHDDIFDAILNGSAYCDHPVVIEPVAAFRWFAQHGLVETLVSYGLDYAEVEHAAEHATAQAVADIVALVPAEHRAFIRALPPLHEEPDLFVAHAMWDVDTPDDAMPARLGQSPEERFKLIWGRYTEKDIQRKKRWRRTGYFGHTPVQSYNRAYEQPLRGPGIVLLDTGAALGFGGRLSAVCVETGEVLQVDRAGRTVEAA